VLTVGGALASRRDGGAGELGVQQAQERAHVRLVLRAVVGVVGRRRRPSGRAPGAHQGLEADEVDGLFEPLAQFGDSLGFAVAVEEIPGDAHGYCEPAAKRIAVEAVSAEFSANAQVKTEVHELAHALVRCERAEEDPELSYAEEEVVVECVAYTVCSTLGLDTGGFSVPYLASWGEGGEIERYAALIDRLASRLEDAALAVDAPEVEEELAAA